MVVGTEDGHQGSLGMLTRGLVQLAFPVAVLLERYFCDEAGRTVLLVLFNALEEQQGRSSE